LRIAPALRGVGCIRASTMSLRRFALSAGRTKSLIQHREALTWRRTHLARPRSHVRGARRVRQLPAGGIRKWNRVWNRRNPIAVTCVVSLILVAADALCKLRRELIELDARYRVTHQCAARVAIRPAEAFRQPLIRVGEQADTVTCLHFTNDDHQMPRRAGRHRMTRPDTQREVAGQ
jgi:hypothetical protein